MDQLGIGAETPFWGYWNKLNPVKKVFPKDERVMVSSYACKDGFLTVLMNDTDSPVTVKLLPDGKRLGKSPVVTDIENGKTTDLQAVTLPARDFRMLHVVKK